MSSPAAACRKALEDATRRWPTRNKENDGIMGDARHQARKSDHNLGNAVDVTHDPSVGCDGHVISAIAIRDPRTTYVIWNRQIYNKARAAEGWRAYHGENPHTHHCHISIHPESRDDVRHWGWSPDASSTEQSPTPTPDHQQPAATRTHPAPAHGAPPHPTPGTGNPAHGAPTQGAPAGTAHGQTPEQKEAIPPLRRPVNADGFPGTPQKRGSSGVLVRRIQQRLKDLRWDLQIDGTFGPETEGIVRKFQKRNELHDDGIVGSRTWRALFP